MEQEITLIMPTEAIQPILLITMNGNIKSGISQRIPGKRRYHKRSRGLHHYEK